MHPHLRGQMEKKKRTPERVKQRMQALKRMGLEHGEAWRVAWALERLCPAG